ncbi:MAG TPA: ATP-binding protein [Candidatus Angelobacter sp.]|nr:ATP-binding protein [Candidatus Angelobacter sp.]
MVANSNGASKPESPHCVQPAGQVATLETIWGKLADGIVISNAEGKISVANATARELGQMDPQGMPLDCAPLIWGRMFDQPGHEVAPAEWPTMRASRGHSTTQLECQLVQAHGKQHDVLFSAAPMPSMNGKPVGVIATLTDITQLKRRTLMLRQKAVSRERNRMAEDIHDGFCQGLSSIMLQLETAQSCLPADCESAFPHLKTACDVARNTMAEARRSMWTFCHESLGDIDPASRLCDVAKLMLRGTRISLSLSLQQELPVRIPLELLRISQEALSNVIKHSQASRVKIALTYRNWALHLLVCDDGRGFVCRSPDPLVRGFGLISMRERAERLGGKIRIDSQPGEGTRVSAVIPLSGPEVGSE